MQTMQLVQNGSLGAPSSTDASSPRSPSQVRAGKPMNRSFTGVGSLRFPIRFPVSGYWRVTGARRPLNVETKVTARPFRLLNI